MAAGGVAAVPLAARFAALWSSLERVGRDPSTGGYRRFAWTEADRALRDWFAGQAADRGMTCEVDRNGNLWAWDGEAADGAVVTGSHLDSVPDGGAFDGPLGVVSAFLAVDELRDRVDRPRRPVAVVAFADEEGARFGVACAGSRLLTGALDPAAARTLTDRDAVPLAEALRAAGVDPEGLGRDERALARIGAYVELHVEQGRALADLDAPVAVATAIVPHGRWHLAFRGAADHAGTTRLADRQDPMLPFAAAVTSARALAEQAGAVATVGRVQVAPNATNAVPAAVDAWLDARAADDAVLDALVAGVTEAAHAAAHGVQVTCTEESRSPAVRFDAALRDRIRAVLGDVPLLPTAAGHDAGILAAEVPAAMLFVRNPSGVSHSPAETADPEDCVAGIEALAAVLEELACR
ncbi:allantoate amidohydrolase [Amnibacterium sp. CER49]|uniref:allantoate amidohydrolase n=1 Tax=Amnibacterium sp. CER49 TaxID=3039161 RepID=UPI00244809B8|nr:allantoate amidohydrolase [Amnibacterium sp. CER49]MDH2444627.1 allantoate amidohydrolase [Amnibacterium sp. CER49]